MDTRDLIKRVVFEMDKEIGYCGSCMSGCDPMTKFICLGRSAKDINNWVDSHKELVDKWESEIDDILGRPDDSINLKDFTDKMDKLPK